VAGVRRSLTYPLYRNWLLTMKLWEDVTIVLKLGKRAVLKCFLEIYTIFEHDELGHYHNRLYIQDYCLWLQSNEVKNRVLYHLAKEISHLDIRKEDIGYPLLELEKSPPI
jgi:protein SHQ1